MARSLIDLSWMKTGAQVQTQGNCTYAHLPKDYIPCLQFGGPSLLNDWRFGPKPHILMKSTVGFPLRENTTVLNTRWYFPEESDLRQGISPYVLHLSL